MSLPLQHLLGIESLTGSQILSLLDSSDSMVEISTRELKKVPALRGKTVVNLFFEPSTRTRTSFEIAAKRLSADVINISVAQSSVVKGESLLDTVRTLEAMAPDLLVVRHSASGVPELLSKTLKRTGVVNAGDGQHEHPTQALLDCVTLAQHFGREKFRNLKIAIVGDVLHSRVARSNVWAHLHLGNEIRLVGPSTLVPPDLEAPEAFKRPSDAESWGTVKVFNNLREGLAGADAVMCLRVQTERLAHFFLPTLEEYSRWFGVSERILKDVAPDAVVLHPGPANRGIEISSDVMDGPRSLVASQVSNGIAVRMGVLFTLGTYQREEAQHVVD